MDDDPFDDFRISTARLCLCAGVVAILLGLALIYRPGQNANSLFETSRAAHRTAQAGSDGP